MSERGSGDTEGGSRGKCKDTVTKRRILYVFYILQRPSVLHNEVIREIGEMHHLHQTDSSKWYRTIKDICGLGKVSRPFPFLTGVPQDEVEEQINNHFSTICQSLPEHDYSLQPSFLPSPSPPSTVEIFRLPKSC